MNSETSPIQPPAGFRVADLARTLRVPRPTLYRWIKTGRLPAVAVGKVLVVLEEDLVRFLQANRAISGVGPLR